MESAKLIVLLLFLVNLLPEDAAEENVDDPLAFCVIASLLFVEEIDVKL